MAHAFAAVLPALNEKNAGQLLDQFAPFNPRLCTRRKGGRYLVVRSHPVSPLRTSRLLREFCTNTQFQSYQWYSAHLDDAGRCTFPHVNGGPP